MCRTHLDGWRLSEDVDLLVDEPGRARDALDALPETLRREFPDLELRWSRDGETWVAVLTTNGMAVHVHVVPRDPDYRRYPTARTPVVLRYEDLPSTVEIDCPTRAGAAAMKLAAWADRAAARDLCDLYGLEKIGALSAEAMRIVADAARPVGPLDFADRRRPSDEAWQAQLAHQMAQPPEVSLAFTTVRDAVVALTQEP